MNSRRPKWLTRICRHRFLLGGGVAVVGGGGTALGREAGLVEIGVSGGLVDAPLERILGLELPSLRRHQAEHDRLALAHAPQRLERAGALGVVFHEITVRLDAIEQGLGDLVVAARSHEWTAAAAAADMPC